MSTSRQPIPVPTHETRPERETVHFVATMSRRHLFVASNPMNELLGETARRSKIYRPFADRFTQEQQVAMAEEIRGVFEDGDKPHVVILDASRPRSRERVQMHWIPDVIAMRTSLDGKDSRNVQKMFAGGDFCRFIQTGRIREAVAEKSRTAVSPTVVAFSPWCSEFDTEKCRGRSMLRVADGHTVTVAMLLNAEAVHTVAPSLLVAGTGAVRSLIDRGWAVTARRPEVAAETLGS